MTKKQEPFIDIMSRYRIKCETSTINSEIYLSGISDNEYLINSRSDKLYMISNSESVEISCSKPWNFLVDKSRSSCLKSSDTKLYLTNLQLAQELDFCFSTDTVCDAQNRDSMFFHKSADLTGIRVLNKSAQAEAKEATPREAIISTEGEAQTDNNNVEAEQVTTATPTATATETPTATATPTPTLTATDTYTVSETSEPSNEVVNQPSNYHAKPLLGTAFLLSLGSACVGLSYFYNPWHNFPFGDHAHGNAGGGGVNPPLEPVDKNQVAYNAAISVAKVGECINNGCRSNKNGVNFHSIRNECPAQGYTNNPVKPGEAFIFYNGYIKTFPTLNKAQAGVVNFVATHGGKEVIEAAIAGAIANAPEVIAEAAPQIANGIVPFAMDKLGLFLTLPLAGKLAVGAVAVGALTGAAATSDFYFDTKFISTTACNAFGQTDYCNDSWFNVWGV